MTKSIQIEGVTDRAYCYWCGKKLKETKEWDEYDCYRDYVCDCEKSKKEMSLEYQIESLKNLLRTLPREQSAIDKEYELIIESLNRKYNKR